MEKDLDSEMKAQKLTESDGKFGWKLVKEYEGPDLAVDNDRAKAFLAAFFCNICDI